MGRWFRRKDKDRKKSRAESEAALEESQAAGGEAPEAEEVEAEAAPPPEPASALPPETPAEPPEEAAIEPRRGFFARFRKTRPAEEPPVEEAIETPETEQVAEPAGAGSPCPEPEPPPESPILEASCAEALVLQKAALEAEPEVEAEFPEEGAEAVEAPGEETEEPRKGMFRRLRERLSRTRETLAGGLDRIFAGKKEIDAALLDELEELLITADIGVETTLFLVQGLHEKLRRRELGDVERLKAALKAEMVALLTAPPAPEASARPWVVLVVGINGVGKTTTIAKLAHRDRSLGLTAMLVAADTFRAAAVEQLEIWGERVGAAVIKQKTGADPAAVVFDGLAAAQARGVDTVYVDTAGRLHTKVNLMEELKKIHRTATKKLPGAPHEVYLVLDATTGQNALSQARLFHEAVGLTGLVLTKMDGTAKGGVALGVVHETGIPLRYIGVGEAMEDLRPFDAEAFVEAILG